MMTAERHVKGMTGETRAAEYLEKRGYTVIDRNYRTRYGEVDIVCQKDHTIIFFEIKNYSVYDESSIEYAVNKRKQKRIVDTSKHFLYKNNLLESVQVRYDVIFVHGEKMMHLENAFTEGGAA